MAEMGEGMRCHESAWHGYRERDGMPRVVMGCPKVAEMRGGEHMLRVEECCQKEIGMMGRGGAIAGCCGLPKEGKDEMKRLCCELLLSVIKEQRARGEKDGRAYHYPS